MRRGLVLIPTFRRPQGLEKALTRLEALDVDAEIAVLVAENDPAGGRGRDVVRRLAPHYRFDLDCIEVTEPGVSQVRNALFAAALARPGIDFAACMDDDEWPEPEWLQALIDMQKRTGAGIVGGTLLPAFAEKPPGWARTFELYRQEQPDGVSAMIWGTCNVLLTRTALERTGPLWFDTALGRIGGEDMEFFARAKASGVRFAWSSAALMHEDVPPSRLQPGWIARRAFRIGSTNTLADLRWRYQRLGRAIVLTKALGRFGLAAAVLICGRRMEALAVVARALGELSGLFGLRKRESGTVRAADGEPAKRGALVSETIP